ncbi:hypothetical protein C8Q79DRAFT_921141, partial [Trametes meyenii]
LLAYEFLITFGREVELFWKRGVTGASMLFFVNRYLPLVFHIYQMTTSRTMSDKAIFSGLRAFALSGRDWPLALLAFLLSLVPVGLNLSQYHWLAAVNDESGFTISSRVSLIIADALVIGITWYSTYRTNCLFVARGNPTSFAQILQRHGKILLVLNSLHLAFALREFATDGIEPASYVTLFTEPITAILISRFLLDLQGVNHSAVAMVDSSAPGTSTDQRGTIIFARVIGPLGSAAAHESMYSLEVEAQGRPTIHQHEREGNIEGDKSTKGII